jgi:hypothetical protein
MTQANASAPRSNGAVVGSGRLVLRDRKRVSDHAHTGFDVPDRPHGVRSDGCEQRMPDRLLWRRAARILRGCQSSRTGRCHTSGWRLNIGPSAFGSWDRVHTGRTPLTPMVHSTTDTSGVIGQDQIRGTLQSRCDLADAFVEPGTHCPRSPRLALSTRIRRGGRASTGGREGGEATRSEG